MKDIFVHRDRAHTERNQGGGTGTPRFPAPVCRAEQSHPSRSGARRRGQLCANRDIVGGHQDIHTNRCNNCFSHILPGISKAAFAFIEAVQPYRGGPLGNHLRLLANLSNIDKHRYLNLTEARLSMNERIVTSRGWYTMVRRIDAGTEVDPIPTTWIDGQEPVEVERSFTSDVSFAEPMLAEWTTYQVPVQEALQICLEDVERIIVPAVDQFLNQP